MVKFNNYFKQRRIELGFTARRFAKEKGYDVGYISRLENGLIAPPAEQEKVLALAKALEIPENSEQMSEFIDMVSVARNEVPVDLRSNEAVLKILPAFYRGARKKTFDEDDVEKLIQLFEEARKEE